MRVIGMISGTSYDAIEAAALTMSMEDGVVVAELLGHVSAPYPADVRAAVAAVLPPASTTIGEVCRLDTLIGQSFAAVAASLGDRFFAGVTDVVCSHGQTVFHWVEDGRALGTLQLGQGAWIAERTGATVVTDVRNRDIAAGGQGAPLASLLDVMILGAHPETVRCALNLGGIANMTVVGPGSEPIAFDVGPANALLDATVQWLSQGAEDHDHDGRRAARGSVDRGLLETFLDDPYYDQAPPKSTGKEHFHLGYLMERIASRDIDEDDLVATLTALTAETVARAVSALGAKELVVSGGGTRNPVLMAELSRRLSDVTVSPVDDLGVPEAAKEAVVFALIGFLSVLGLPGSIASCTGARRASVLGSIIPGRQVVARPSGDAPPTRFHIGVSSRPAT